MPAVPTPAQSAASRLNGARSRGPATPEGKARSARNGVRHGLSGRTFFLLDDEGPQDYRDLACDYLAALAPRDVLEHQAVDALVQALWREQRASRLEAEILDERFAAALIEDPAEARAVKDRAMQDLDRLLRYGARIARDRARAECHLEALRRRELAPPRHRPPRDEPDAAAADPLAAVNAALAAIMAAHQGEAEAAAALGLRDEPEPAPSLTAQHEPESAAASLPAVRREPEPARKLNRRQRRVLAAKARHRAA